MFAILIVKQKGTVWQGSVCVAWSSPDRWMDVCGEADISVSFSAAKCSEQPSHFYSGMTAAAKKCLPFPGLCVSFSANVCAFVYDGDKWWFGKMLGDQY